MSDTPTPVECSTAETVDLLGLNSNAFTDILDDLAGRRSQWDLTFQRPSPELPDGHRHPVVIIDHEWYDEWTTVCIVAERDVPDDDFNVAVPMTTDILTVAEGVTGREALRTAVEHANNHRVRLKPSLTARALNALGVRPSP